MLPQVHGAALDLLGHVDDQVARELRAVTDSPLFLDADGDEPAGLYPSGNFHAQALSPRPRRARDRVRAGRQPGEKRLHRLLDARFSGLNDQLAPTPAARPGSCSSTRPRSATSPRTGCWPRRRPCTRRDGSAGQEDVQSFAFLAADKLDRLLDNVELLLRLEVLARGQARELRDAPLRPAWRPGSRPARPSARSPRIGRSARTRGAAQLCGRASCSPEAEGLAPGVAIGLLPFHANMCS